MNSEHQPYSVNDLVEDTLHNALRSKDRLLAQNATSLTKIVTVYEELMGDIDDMLSVPAAEYVPAIADTLAKISEAQKAARALALGLKS